MTAFVKGTARSRRAARPTSPHPYAALRAGEIIRETVLGPRSSTTMSSAALPDGMYLALRGSHFDRTRRRRSRLHLWTKARLRRADREHTAKQKQFERVTCRRHRL